MAKQTSDPRSVARAAWAKAFARSAQIPLDLRKRFAAERVARQADDLTIESVALRSPAPATAAMSSVGSRARDVTQQSDRMVAPANPEPQ